MSLLELLIAAKNNDRSFHMPEASRVQAYLGHFLSNFFVSKILFNDTSPCGLDFCIEIVVLLEVSSVWERKTWHSKQIIIWNRILNHCINCLNYSILITYYCESNIMLRLLNSLKNLNLCTNYISIHTISRDTILRVFCWHPNVMCWCHIII